MPPSTEKRIAECKKCKLFGICLGDSPRGVGQHLSVCSYCVCIFRPVTGKRFRVCSKDDVCSELFEWAAKSVHWREIEQTSYRGIDLPVAGVCNNVDCMDQAYRAYCAHEIHKETMDGLTS